MVDNSPSNPPWLETEYLKEKIAADIETGDYFKNAFSWFDAVYNAPLAQRSYLIMIGMIAAGIIWYSYQAFQGILPLETRRSVTVQFPETYSKHYELVRLAERYEYANRALIDFHVRDYVSVRETYIVDGIDSRYRRITSLSTVKTFEEFQNFIDPRNSESPIALYERHTSRLINIRSVRLMMQDGTPENSKNLRPDKAIVEFTANIIPIGSPEKTENWVAELTFNYKNLEVEQETGKMTPMDFLVTSYKSSRKIGE